MDPVKKLYDAMDAEGLDDVRGHRKPPLRFRPSEAADCVRQIWFRLRGQRPAPRDGTSNKYGIDGDNAHDTTRLLFNHYGSPVLGVDYDEHGRGDEKMVKKTEYEVVLPEDGGTVKVLISGRADGAIVLEEGEDPELLEVKSMGFYKYDWMAKAYEKEGTAGALARVKEKEKSYWYQCQVSMGLFGFKKCYLVMVDRSTGTIGLYNKTTGKREGLVLDFDPKVWQEILDKFAYIKYKLNVDEKPLAEYPASSYQCTYCPFKYACHDAAKRRKQGLSPAVVYPGPQMEIYNDPDPEATTGADSGDQRQDAQRQDDNLKAPD